MSMWLGPPWRKSKITLFARGLMAVVFALACNARKSVRPSPNRLSPPTRINSRRDGPSHVVTGRPGRDNIAGRYYISSPALLLAAMLAQTPIIIDHDGG